MFEQLKKAGIECRLADNVHMKYLATPFCVLSGSLNFSYNGVHGRTQEATNHFLVGTSDYNLSRRGISNLLASSYIYDTAQTYTLSNWQPPEIDWFVSEIDGIEIYSEPIPSHIESEESYETLNIDNDEYSSHTPKEIHEGTYLDNHSSARKYIQSKYIQLLQRLGAFVLDTIQSHVDSETRNSLESAITPTLIREDIGEILPSLLGIKNALEIEAFPSGLSELLLPLLVRLRIVGRRCLSESTSPDMNVNELFVIERQMEIIIGVDVL